MKKSGRWNFRSIFGKIMLGIVLTAMVGSIDVMPAFSRDDYRGPGKYDNGRYDNRGRRYDRNHRHVQRRQPRRVYRPYGYGERVYVPPRVVFAPPPPPGISIFFPPLFIRP